MIVWRLTCFALLDGAGGLVAPGRWHTKGRRIIYTAATPAGALIEVLVGLDLGAGEIPDGYRLIGIEIDERIKPHDVLPSTLPKNWATRPQATRAIGDQWLVEGRQALLRVPSCLIDQAVNVLVSPALLSSDDMRVVYDEAFAFDPRLL